MSSTSKLFATATAVLANQPCEADFVFPALACVLAASRLRTGRDPAVTFKDASNSYADHSGLRSALCGGYEEMVRPRTEGQTWSRLTTLYRHAEIEGCNQAINDLIFHQMAGMPRSVLDKIAKVVGELHDNVASHASGRGFSAAQFYRKGRPRLEVAIADGGTGFLRNVHRVEPSITNHGAAIEWCLTKGNTAWRPPSQKAHLLDRCDPYSDDHDRAGQRDHHMGLGLWSLTELVRATRGTLLVWTGDAAYSLFSDGATRLVQTPVGWSGVVIELVLYPDQAIQVDLDPSSPRLESLAKELGL